MAQVAVCTAAIKENIARAECASVCLHKLLPALDYMSNINVHYYYFVFKLRKTKKKVRNKTAQKN